MGIAKIILIIMYVQAYGVCKRNLILNEKEFLDNNAQLKI